MLLTVLPVNGYCQIISEECSSYTFFSKETKQTEERLCHKYCISNDTKEPLVVMFSLYDISSDSLDGIIYKRLFRPFNGIPLDNIVCEDMNLEKWTPLVPYDFIKLIEPSECFDMIITDNNKDIQNIDSIFKHHLIICSSEPLNKISRNFIDNLRNKNLSFSGSFISIDTDIFKGFIYPKKMQ